VVDDLYHEVSADEAYDEVILLVGAVEEEEA
jgi:hypothetical protein